MSTSHAGCSPTYRTTGAESRIPDESGRKGTSLEADEFNGRIAVVTGGGRGFGFAFGQALVERGAHPILTDLDQAATEATAEKRSEGLQATGVRCDVANEGEVAAMVDAVLHDHEGIGILVNNAGLHSSEYAVSFEALGLTKIRQIFDVNVMCVIICTMAARQAMASGPRACVFTVSSRPSTSTTRR